MKLTKFGKEFLVLVVLFIIVAYFWDSVLVYPVKLFVVLLHEMSHGIAAVLLGGKIQNIEISREIGGYTSYSMPKGWTSEIIVASVGYLGSMFWGGLILIGAAKINKDRYISLVIGIVSLILGLFVIKSGELFGIIYTFGFAGFMILAYKYLKDWFHDYMLKFIGLTSCLYVIVDIKEDLISRSVAQSDAGQISALTGIPSIVIGLSWALISIVFIGLILKVSLGGRAKNRV